MTSEGRWAMARLFASGELAPDMCPSFHRLPKAQRDEVMHWALSLRLDERLQRRDPAQRRAMRLLRTWLTAGQRAQLDSCGYFTVVGSLGGLYRLHPHRGGMVRCESLERHGRREYARGGHYCMHDREWQLPPADVVLAHLLMLRTDEAEFIVTANYWPRESQMWDGAYLRRVRARQRTEEFRREVEAARRRVRDGAREHAAATRALRAEAAASRRQMAA